MWLFLSNRLIVLVCDVQHIQQDDDKLTNLGQSLSRESSQIKMTSTNHNAEKCCSCFVCFFTTVGIQNNIIPSSVAEASNTFM